MAKYDILDDKILKITSLEIGESTKLVLEDGSEATILFSEEVDSEAKFAHVCVIEGVPTVYHLGRTAEELFDTARWCNHRE